MPDFLSWLFPLSNFLIAWIVLDVPFFAGRGWLALSFVLYGVNGLTWRLAPYGTEFYDVVTTVNPVLSYAALGSIGLAAYSWYRGQHAERNAPETAVAPIDNGPGPTTIPQNQTNSISKAEAVRDLIYALLTNACKREKIAAEVYPSPPFGETIWVEVRVQQPIPNVDNVFLRSSARVTITPKEFHRFAHEMKIEVNDSRKTKSFVSIVDFTPKEARAICRYIGGRERKLRLRPTRCRTFAWQLWRPRNKLTGLKRSFSISAIIAVGGLALMSFHPAGAAALLGAAAYWYFFEKDKFRRILSLSSGKPQQEPRILVRLDSWQAVLSKLSHYAPDLRDELRTTLNGSPPADPGSSSTTEGEISRPSGLGERHALGQSPAAGRFRVFDEKVWYRGIDGKVERQQIVVRLRRAIGFVHIYPYGNDLYVGWDAYINGGAWSEKSLGQGREPSTGRIVRAYGITPSWQTPHEYDITDANFLIEWIHSAVTKVVKQALKDHRIDQEIDFTVTREARQGVAGRERPGAKKKKERKSPFRRTA